MKTNLESNMEDLLNLPVSEEICEHKEIEVLPPEDDTREQDFKLARENIHEVIQQGKHALDDLCDLANASQNARAYEVLGDLIRTITDANMKLMDLHKQKKDLDPEADKPKNVTNNLFIGSTAELQKLINPRKVAENVDASDNS